MDFVLLIDLFGINKLLFVKSVLLIPNGTIKCSFVPTVDKVNNITNKLKYAKGSRALRINQSIIKINYLARIVRTICHFGIVCKSNVLHAHNNPQFTIFHR